METVEARGMKFKLRPETSDRIVYEDNVIRQSYLKHGVTVEPGQGWMDIGAYIGTFAINLAKQGAKVIAFEPDPENLICFKRNIRLNKAHIIVNQNAIVQEDNGSMPLYQNTFKGNMAANTLYPHWAKEKPSIIVPVITFDEAFKLSQQILKMEHMNIKFDCEGAEIPILRNLKDYPIDQLTFEYHFSVEPDCQRWWEIHEHLKDLGYSIKTTAKVPNEGNWPNPRQQTMQVYCIR